MAQSETEKSAHRDTASGTGDISLVLSELQALRTEVAELRQMMRLIEHKPDLAPPVTPKSVPNEKGVPWWRRLFLGKSK